MKDRLEVSNMTREQKANEHFEKHPFCSLYLERDENNFMVYIQDNYGNSRTTSYYSKNIIFVYLHIKTLDNISFINIITCK